MTKFKESLENVKDFSSVLDQVTYLNDLIPFYFTKFSTSSQYQINLVQYQLKLNFLRYLQWKDQKYSIFKDRKKNIKIYFPYRIINRYENL